MKTTLALGWKALVSKIHPPLSLSPRDSQKLLSLLNASFQRRLDAQLPFRLEDTSHHANAHMQSILGNPLFGSKPSRRRDSSVKKLQDDGHSISGLKYWMQQPLDAFQKGVSNGTASLETAKLCLELQLKNCLASCISTSRGIMDTAGTGSAVLDWLWSSGMEESGLYLRDMDFIRLLTVFLVIEQRYDVIFNWFSQPQSQDPALAENQSKKSQTAQPNLLLQLVKSETGYGAGLGAAMVHFTQYFQRKTTDNYWASRRVYGPAGSFLAHELTNPGQAETIPKDILSWFVATTRGWADHTSFANAILHAYRPESPRPDVALRYLQQFTKERLELASASRRRRLILMSLKAAELLLARNQRREADWILDFIQKNYGEEVGAKPPSRQPKISGLRSSVEEEALSLRLLETLGIP